MAKMVTFNSQDLELIVVDEHVTRRTMSSDISNDQGMVCIHQTKFTTIELWYYSLRFPRLESERGGGDLCFLCFPPPPLPFSGSTSADFLRESADGDRGMSRSELEAHELLLHRHTSS